MRQRNSSLDCGRSPNLIPVVPSGDSSMSSALDSVGVSTGSAAFTPPAIDGNLTGKHIVSVEQFASARPA